MAADPFPLWKSIHDSAFLCKPVLGEGLAKGTVDCGTALRVENEYAAKIRSGQVQGNGGGAPVAVSGWTCQGYPTPQVLSTGNTSQCHTSSAAIVAVLPVPTPARTMTTG
jgi:hypothetical protein